MKNLILLSVAIILACFGNTANAFTCTTTGLFKNSDSNDCKTFVSCDYNMQSEVHNCPVDTFFWPEKSGCFSGYTCATSSMSGNTNPCDGLNYNDVPDPTSSDCSKYIQCSTSYVNNYSFQVVTSVQCASGSAFRPGSGCVSGYQCTNYACPSEGVFPNPNSVDCKNFVQCWRQHIFYPDRAPQLYSNVVQCPPNSKFNPQLKKCDSFYNCGQNDPHGGVDPCGNYTLGNPRIPNPSDSTQKTYIQCQYQDNGVYREGIVVTECPEQTYFSSLLRKCYSAHVPNEMCSRDPCSNGAGKYVNYPSGSCQSFIECRDDTIDPALYEPTYEIRYCPPGTLFSPTAGKPTGKCKANYACPAFPGNYCYVPITTPPPAVATTAAAR